MPSLIAILGLDGKGFAAGLNKSVADSKVAGKQISDALNVAPNISKSLSRASVDHNNKEYQDRIKASIAEREASIVSASRSNQARRLLRQRAAERELRDAVSAQQRTDAAVQQASRDNLARRLRRERDMKRAAAAEEAYQNSFGGRVSAFFSGAVGRVAAVATVFAAASAAKRYIAESINMDIAHQRVFNTLRAGTGSVKQAADEFEFLRFVAHKTGNTVTSMGSDYAGAMMAAKSLGLSVNDTRRIFEAFTTAGASLGLPVERQKLVMNALTQMMSKGTVSMEELRGQLAESMPMAFDLFSKALGVSKEKMMEMVAAGEVSADVLVKIAEVIENTPDLQRVNETTAAIGRLKNAWEELQASHGKQIRPETEDAAEKLTFLLRLLKAIGVEKRSMSDRILGNGVSWKDLFRELNPGDYDEIAEVLSKTDLGKKMAPPKRPEAAKDQADDGFYPPKEKVETEAYKKLAKERSDLAKQLSEEEKRGAKIGLTDAQERLRLEREILKAKQAPYSATPADLLQQKIDIKKAENALKEFDASRPKGAREFSSINDLQRVGAYSAQSLDVSMLNEQKLANGFLARITKAAESRQRTQAGGTKF